MSNLQFHADRDIACVSTLPAPLYCSAETFEAEKTTISPSSAGALFAR
jgi:hypothetical protein